MINTSHYVSFKSGIEIFLIFDNMYIKESTSLFEHDQFHFGLKDRLVALIDVNLIESIYHYNEVSDIVDNNKIYDYHYKPLIDDDVLPFPEVEYRFRVFNDCFDQDYKKYSDALEFARVNACAIFDKESCKILDDYREGLEDSYNED